ncbi:MAG: translation initiation factor IF-2 [Nanoarchaeota archaeon]
MEKIRSPIVTVCGHVDHGKTSILDSIRGTKIADEEAGRITQKISSTFMPAEIIIERAGAVLEKFRVPLEIPGFLYIDTPGHAAFTNLRKRGGSLADLAVLVIDINEGIKPQTSEVLQILRANKTPFIIALNKIDNISGWKSSSEFFFENIEKQAIRIREIFDEKLYTLIGSLSSYKFDAELYTKITDFTKNIAIVPCSAKTKEGISEILAILCALSQKFLKQRISLHESAKGVILEVKKEKAMNYIESILYDGTLKLNDEIIIANLGIPIVTKVRSVQEALPLSKGYKSVENSSAASGLRLQITSKEEVLPGMRFQKIENNFEELKKEFSEELEKEIQTDNQGILIKAESLGSLEALLFLLRQKQIKVIKAGIGNITKKDIYQASINAEEDKVILGFNVEVEKEIDEKELKEIKIITNPVVFKIIEDFEEWKSQKLKEIERGKLEELPNLAKITILQFVFRNSNPAIFGVRIDGGILKQEIELINQDDEKIGRIKTIQEDKSTLSQAEKGKEIAISIPGVNFERQLKESQYLYSNLSESQFRKFKEHKNLLSQDEVKILQEIAEIKRKFNPTWGI